MSNLLSNDLTNLVHDVKVVVNRSLKKHQGELTELDDRKKELYDLEKKIARFGGRSAQKKLNSNSAQIRRELDLMDFEIQNSILKDIQEVFN